MFNVNDIYTAVLAIIGSAPVTTYLVKRFGKDAPAVAKEIVTGAETVGKDVGHVLEDLAKTPWFASEAAAGKLEVKHVTDKLESLTAVKEAQTILLGVGKFYAGMTDAEKVKAESLLKLVLSAAGQNVSETTIKDVFAQADKAIADLKANHVFDVLFGETQATA